MQVKYGGQLYAAKSEEKQRDVGNPTNVCGLEITPSCIIWIYLRHIRVLHGPFNRFWLLTNKGLNRRLGMFLVVFR